MVAINHLVRRSAANSVAQLSQLGNMQVQRCAL